MKINSYSELRSVLSYEAQHHRELDKYPGVTQNFYHTNMSLAYTYIRLLRWDEYLDGKKNLLFYLPKVFVRHRRIRIGNVLGSEIPLCAADRGLAFWHSNIIINSNAKIGENVLFHGNNCVGNKGGTDTSGNAPVIGNNVDVGFGSVIIGDITIADDVTIGANAVVTRSCLERGAVLAGNPARIIRHGHA